MHFQCSNYKLESYGTIKRIDSEKKLQRRCRTLNWQSTSPLIIENFNTIIRSFDIEQNRRNMIADVQKIKNFMVVENSSKLTNLNFSTNLQVIGSQSWNQTQNKFSLTVENLQELFEFPVKMVHVRGSILIKLNKFLCHQSVEKFAQTVLKQSRNSIEEIVCLPSVESKVIMSFHVAVIEVSKSIKNASNQIIYQHIESSISHRVWWFLWN